MLLLVPKQVPAAATPTASNLICYCSLATVACIRYNPKLFRAFRPVSVWVFRTLKAPQQLNSFFMEHPDID